MGTIHEAVEQGILRNSNSIRFRNILRAFLPDFDVTWGASRRVFGSSLSVFLLKPEPHMCQTFGFERELLLVFAPYKTLEARILQAAGNLMLEAPARGRVEPLMFVLVTPEATLQESVARLLSDSTQSRIPIPFEESECIENRDSYFIRQRFQQSLFSRDLFDIRQALSSDLYFFGRSSLFIDLRDSIKQGENIGLFGLRKMGKTSLVFKLMRAMNDEGLGNLVYLDLQDSALYGLRWWELLDAIREKIPGIQVSRKSNERNASKLFRSTIEKLTNATPGKRLVIALDEVEHISPGLCMKKHWDEDFLDFWKTLRSIQNVNRHISLLVAGVNASVVETPTYSGHDNPLFSLVKVRYMPAFEIDEVRNMVRTLGRYMGLAFDEETYSYLRETYGGHPLLTRLACSFIHKQTTESTPRPAKISSAMLTEQAPDRNRTLFSFGSHILGMLKQWYPCPSGKRA